MTLAERMAKLDEHIEKGREWDALRIVSEEIKSLYRALDRKQDKEGE